MLCTQVRPPSSDAPLTRPRAPPFDQRSCCQTPTRLFGLRGLTEIMGSTSVLTYSVPTAGTPSHPAAKGVVAVTRNCGSGSCGAASLFDPPPPPHAATPMAH